jgi:outer membrane protein assembly factor BamB
MRCLLFVLVVGSTGSAFAADWPAFRGDGTSRLASGRLPATWSPERGIAWRSPLPGYGQSSPVVIGSVVYATAIDGQDKETLIVRATSAADGRPLWTKEFPASAKGKNNPMMARAAGTPVADARGVVATFECGDIIALSPTGELRWKRTLGTEFGEWKNNHGTGSSLAQSADAVFVQADHQGPSFLFALSKTDGATLWKVERSPRSSWTSPVVMTIEGREAILVSSGGSVAAYRTSDGTTLWEKDGFVGNTIPSPTPFGDKLLVGATENRMKPDRKASAESNCCLSLSAAGARVEWKAKSIIGHHASPIAHEGHVYVVDKGGMLACLDAATGDERYTERLDNQQWATPIACGPHVYFFGKDGVTTVLKAGPSYELVARNRLWSDEQFRAKKKAAETELKGLPSGPPGGRPGGGGAGMNPEELAAIRASAVGDVVYGVAAVPGTIFVRTGTELIAIRQR